MIVIARESFLLESQHLLELLEESNKRLEPFGDPLEIDFGAHRWLAADREEAYSDWLQWVVEHLDTPERVFRLFQTNLPDGLAHLDRVAPIVEREVWVPQGHPGHSGRLDLVIRYGERALLVVEIKTCGADAADTAKQKGYQSWLQSQRADFKPEPVLLAVDARNETYAGGFRFVSWADVCLELRHLVPELRGRGKLLVAAMALALVGAVEQNLLGFSAKLVKRIRAGYAATFDSTIVDHLKQFCK
jgi:hypothetical protein